MNEIENAKAREAERHARLVVDPLTREIERRERTRGDPMGLGPAYTRPPALSASEAEILGQLPADGDPLGLRQADSRLLSNPYTAQADIGGLRITDSPLVWRPPVPHANTQATADAAYDRAFDDGFEAGFGVTDRPSRVLWFTLGALAVIVANTFVAAL